jgi:hypothetical protein
VGGWTKADGDLNVENIIFSVLTYISDMILFVCALCLVSSLLSVSLDGPLLIAPFGFL